MGDKKGDSLKLFETHSLGIATNRDAWCFNASKGSLESNISRMIHFYNGEVDRFNNIHGSLSTKDRNDKVDGFIDADATKISWTRSLKGALAKNRKFLFESECLTESFYRPFTGRWLYFNRQLNEMVNLMPRLFPSKEVENRAIMIKQRWSGDGFLALMIDRPAEMQTDGGAQCFPLNYYEKADEAAEDELFSTTSTADTATHTRRDGITDTGLSHFQHAYPAKGEGSSITKEDLFYYIYGLLHSPDYRTRYADNLGKELPRIPAVKTFADFRAFSQAGRELAHWHLNYETVACHPGVTVVCGKEEGLYCPSSSAPATAEEATVRSPLLKFRVTKMKFGKTKDPETGKSVNDKTTVIYNEYITLKNIPLAAYDYIVNGKPALEWVMERQSVTTDKDSGITNDANLWATETMGNPRYPLELFLRVVTVGLETMKVVGGLPKLDH